MIIKAGQTIPSLEDGRYGMRLLRHEGSLVGPLAEANSVVDVARSRGYYKEFALEDMEIVGPFQYLYLMRGPN